MISQVITQIQNDLLGILDDRQMQRLSESLHKHLIIFDFDTIDAKPKNCDLLSDFISSKRVEGCSENTLRYYESTIRNMIEMIGKRVQQITTSDLRSYLDTYQR